MLSLFFSFLYGIKDYIFPIEWKVIIISPFYQLGIVMKIDISFLVLAIFLSFCQPTLREHLCGLISEILVLACNYILGPNEF